MFGVIRQAKNTPDSPEFINLTANTRVDARNYTVLACDQCRDRKLKCSGDPDGCRRCLTASTVCTYRSAARPTGVTIPNGQQSSSNSEATSCDSATGPANSNDQSAFTHAELQLATDSVTLDLWSGFNDSVPNFDTYLQDWTTGEPQGASSARSSCAENPPRSARPRASPQVTQHTTAVSAAVATPQVHNRTRTFSMAPFSTYNPQSNFAASSGSPSGGCECLRIQADILEQIGDNNEDGHFDDLLGDLRNGLARCRRTLTCTRCSLISANPMMVVTVVQQLVLISQALCQQLAGFRQQGATDATTPLSLSAGISVGTYQMIATASHLKLLAPMLQAHLKDFQQLLDHLQEDIKKDSRASKLLNKVANDVTQCLRGCN